VNFEVSTTLFNGCLRMSLYGCVCVCDKFNFCVITSRNSQELLWLPAVTSAVRSHCY